MTRLMILSLPGLCMLVLPAGGCTNKPDADRPPVYPVTGTITQGGKPIAGATVKFELADGSRTAIGKTDEQGEYSLTTYEPGDGAIAGAYKVAVVKHEQPTITLTDSQDTDQEAPEEREDVEHPPPKSLLPPIYADPATSGFTADVTADGPNEFNFDLM